MVVASWIVWRCSHIDALDDPVVDDHREALAAHVTKHAHGARVMKLHAEGAGDLAPGVGHETHNGTLCLLVLGPTLHDRTIVDAEDDNLSNALGLQFLSLSQIARHLARRSGRREGARQAHKDDLPACTEARQRHLGWWEAFVERHIGDRVANLDNDHGSNNERFGTTDLSTTDLSTTKA
eukprot:TRINITY_DN737_c0_g1_i2.p1 TRINITY_DN737_c0_g1~~TRINITY_DN737_c0_g1_i2.p1  ORF type:complete len:180 (+),score=20.79 TRINITY_DN737_c0_g1_i2:448-987(+)